MSEELSEDAEDLEEMDLFDHLRELRSRLLYVFLTVGIFGGASFTFSRELFDFLNRPFALAFVGHELIGTGPAEAFLLRVKLSIFAGIIVGSPVIFYQIWAFVAPGLYDNEKRQVLPFLFCSTVLFCVGLSFCYYAVLPFAYEFFLTQYEEIGTSPTLRVSEHLSLSIKALLGFGLVFEMPVLAYFLGRIGILRSETLIGAFRYAMVAIFLLAAFLTPPDILTQFLMAGPMLLLYGASILIVKMVEPSLEEPSESETNGSEESNP